MSMPLLCQVSISRDLGTWANTIPPRLQNQPNLLSDTSTCWMLLQIQPRRLHFVFGNGSRNRSIQSKSQNMENPF